MDWARGKAWSIDFDPVGLGFHLFARVKYSITQREAYGVNAGATLLALIRHGR
jgi:hypothetical protein